MEKMSDSEALRAATLTDMVRVMDGEKSYEEVLDEVRDRQDRVVHPVELAEAQEALADAQEALKHSDARVDELWEEAKALRTELERARRREAQWRRLVAFVCQGAKVYCEQQGLRADFRDDGAEADFVECGSD